MAYFTLEENCTDPVNIILGGERSSKQFSVGTDGLGSDETIDSKSVRVAYGRNTTHLHFKVCVFACLSLFEF